MAAVQTTDSLLDRQSLRAFVPILGGTYAVGVTTYVIAVSLGPAVNDWFEVLVAVAGIGTFLAAVLCARSSIPTPAQFIVGLVPLALVVSWRALGLILEVEFADDPLPGTLVVVFLLALFAGEAVSILGYELGSRF